MQIPVREIMTPRERLITVREGATLEEAKALMHKHKLERVLVVNDAFELRGLAQQPVYDPVSQLIYATSRHCVEHLWVAGKPLLDEGRLTRLDEARIIANTQQWGAKIGHR